MRNAHLVQFYPDGPALAKGAGDFLATGLRKHEAVVVIATPAHRRLLAAELRRRRAGLAEAVKAGRYRALDAEWVMARFLRSGHPVRELFAATLNPVIAEAREKGHAARVRLYGEMVDLLWRRGNVSAALELEALWDRLLDGRQIPLYCAYKADAAAAPSELTRMAAAHTRVVTPV